MAPHTSFVARHSSPSAPSARSRGSVLLETVVCLPLLLFFVTGIIQFARLWEARFFTWLAAYNGARAAMVYNEREYFGRVVETNQVYHSKNIDRYLGKGWKYVMRGNEGGTEWAILERESDQFYRDKGIVWLAAVNTLAWMSETEDFDSLFFPTLGHVPHSSRIREQVEIVPERPTESEGDMRFCEEKTGYVRVCVAFRFPLVFSVFDPAVLWRRPADNHRPMAQLAGVEPDNAAARRAGRLGRTFTLYETVLLPKPWTTKHYPLLSKDERRHLLEASDGALAAEIPHWWDNE